MKTSTLFFYCILITTSLALAGCAVNQSLESNASITRKTTKNKACPLSTIQIIQGTDRLRVIAYSDVCFRHNEKLTANCARKLSQAIKLIRSYGEGLIQVVGYSDDLYDPQTAAAITQEQAEIITNFLWLNGVGSQRLRTIGYGGRDFIASNRNVRASSFNRRVEIILVKNKAHKL